VDVNLIEEFEAAVVAGEGSAFGGSLSVYVG
jgi:hypothetical protein